MPQALNAKSAHAEQNGAIATNVSSARTDDELGSKLEQNRDKLASQSIGQAPQ